MRKSLLSPKEHPARTRHGFLTPVGLLVLFLVGCRSAPAPILKGRLQSLAAPTSEEATTRTWWRRIDDPLLDELARKALYGNFSVQAAALRLDEANGVSHSTVWSLTPKTNLQDQYQGTHTLEYAQKGYPSFSFPEGLSGTNTKSFNVSWEVPLFGKASGMFAQGRAKSNQAYWQLAAAKVAVTSELVKDYAAWRGLGRDIESYRTSEAAFEELEALESQTRDKGGATQADIDKALTQKLSIVEQRYTAEGQRNQMASRIAALVGDPELALPGEQQAGAYPELLIPAVSRIQANALRLRPDVRAAEELVSLASAQARIAKASLYPQFTLGGSIIFNAGSLDTYGGTRGVANVANVSTGLTIPLLDWFGLKAQSDAANTELKAVVMDYRQTVISAWEEARSAYDDYTTALKRETALADQLELAKTEVARQRALAERGLGTRMDVVQAELSREYQQRALEEERFGGLQAWAKLMKASFISEDRPDPRQPAAAADTQ
jgi:outer membrane protein TolC